MRDGLRAYTVQKGESGVVVELSDVVPALRVVNAYRSERADRELPTGARYSDSSCRRWNGRSIFHPFGLAAYHCL